MIDDTLLSRMQHDFAAALAVGQSVVYIALVVFAAIAVYMVLNYFASDHV